MLFQNNLTQKQIEKYSQSSKKELLPIPDTWEEFVSLTKIRSGGKLKSFKPFPYQKKLIELGDKYKRIIVLKSRQLGITQAIVSKFLYDACRNPAASSIAFMRNGEDASAISRRCRQMLASISSYAIASNDNVGYLKINEGGDIYFKNSGAQGSRSLDSATGMLFDEAAFVPTIASIYSASSPSGAMSDNCVKYIVSTPSAKSGWYWDQLSQDNGRISIEALADAVAANEFFEPHYSDQDRLRGEDLKIYQEKGFAYFVDLRGTCKVVIHFLANEYYNQSDSFLLDRQEADGTDFETVEREYNLRFVNTAVGVFDSSLIRENAVGAWEDYDENAYYYAGIDTSTTGKDYTVCVILKYTGGRYKGGKYKVVNVYSKRKETADFNLFQIFELLEKYKVNRVGIEITGGVGQIYLEQLQQKIKDIQRYRPLEALKTTKESKERRINNLILALERKEIDFPLQSNLVKEFLSFQREGDKLQAAPGKHDDELMALSFAYDIATSKEETGSRQTNWEGMTEEEIEAEILKNLG